MARRAPRRPRRRALNDSMGVEPPGAQFPPEAKTSLEHVARDLAALTSVALVALGSADERTRTLSVAAALGEGAASLPLVTLPYGVGAVGWIAANRAPLEISDVFRDARFVGHDWRKSHGLASFSGAPLVVDGRLLGVLALDARAPIELTATQRKGVAGFGGPGAALVGEGRRQDGGRPARGGHRA